MTAGPVFCFSVVGRETEAEGKTITATLQMQKSVIPLCARPPGLARSGIPARKHLTKYRHYYRILL